MRDKSGKKAKNTVIHKDCKTVRSKRKKPEDKNKNFSTILDWTKIDIC